MKKKNLSYSRDNEMHTHKDIFWVTASAYIKITVFTQKEPVLT